MNDRSLLVILLAFALGGCALSKEVGLVASGSASGFSYFQSTLHPALMASCRNCHGDGGVQIQHSQSSVSGAYTVARAKATTLGSRAGDGHCGTSACVDGGNCTGACNSIAATVTTWRSLEGI